MKKLPESSISLLGKGFVVENYFTITLTSSYQPALEEVNQIGE